MHYVCLCPTYGRPSLAANALALFLAQRLRDGDTALLVIFDDVPQILPYREAWPDNKSLIVLTAADRWYPLPQKYDAMLARLGGIDPDAVYVQWDDDDVYLPWHLEAIGRLLDERPECGWCQPSRIWSTYGIDPRVEQPRPEITAGRFPGCHAVRGELLAKIGTWSRSKLATFDQLHLADLEAAGGPRGDVLDVAPCSYVYRWGDTGLWHCSGTIDDGRYRQPPIQEPGSVEVIRPAYDASTVALLRRLQSGLGDRRAVDGPAARGL
jgi:hypothetical protein